MSIEGGRAPDEPFYRASEVARLVGVSKEWIRQLIRKGEIVTVDLAQDWQAYRNLRIPASEVQRLRERYAQGKQTWADRKVPTRKWPD